MNKRSLLKTLALSLALASASAFAQTSPRPVRLLVSLPAGSAIDFYARLVAPHMSTALGQPIVVDNKAGGRDIIAMTELIKSAPDGHTLYMGSLSPLAMNVALVKSLPYDPRKDVTPIAGLVLVNHILVVRSTSPVKTFSEFVAHAKQNPGKVSIGYATSMVQMQIASMNRLAGMELLPVPYKGTSQTITDVMGGSLDATLLDPNNALAQIKGGQMRGLAVTSVKRNPLTPDLPAIAETLPGFDFSTWTALVGPPGMSRELVTKINAAMNHALAQKDVVDRLAQAATLPFVTTPEALKSLIETDTAKWIKLTREANIQPE